MSTLLDKNRLASIASVAGEPLLPHETAAGRPILTMRWSIDLWTGRPVGCWVVDQKPCATDSVCV